MNGALLLSEDIRIADHNILSGVLHGADILRDCVSHISSGGIERVGGRCSLVDLSRHRGNIVVAVNGTSERVDNVSLAAVNNWIVSSGVVDLILRNFDGSGFLINLHLLKDKEKNSDGDKSKNTSNNNEGDEIIVADVQRASCDLVVVLKGHGVLLLTESRIELLEECCTEVNLANVLRSADGF